MSNWRKEAKAASEAKMNRMGLNKKTEKTPTFDGVHAWDGLPGLDSGLAGKKPVGKQRFKRGGKVKHMAAEGGASNQHLGKAPRKKAEGGRLPGQSEASQYAQARRKAYDAYKSASEASSAADKISAGDYDPAVKQYARENAKKMAAKSVGPDEGFGRAMKETGYGYAKGGFAGANPAARKAMAAKIAYKKKGQSGSGFGNISYGMPRAKGGKVHEDEAMDRKLVKSMVKPASLKGRSAKAEGGSAERWLKTPKGSRESMEGLGSLEYREHTARAKPFKSREERGPYRTPQHFRDLEGSIARLSEKTARMNPNSKSAKEGPKYGGTKGVQRKHREEDENASLTSSGLKHGGRAEKAGGGSLRSQFNEAFRNARNAGEKTFEWNGKQYNTELYKPTTGPSFRGTGRPTPQYAPKQENKMPDVDVMGNATGMRKGGAAHKARGGSLSKDEAMAKKLNISSRRNIKRDEELEQLRRWKGLQKALSKQTRSKMFPKGMYHPSEYGDEGEPEATPERMRSIENTAFRKSVDEANKRIGNPDFAEWAEKTKEEKGYNAKGGRIQRATGGRTRRKSSKTNIIINLPQGGQQGAQGGMQPAIPPELLAAMMGGGGAPGMPPAGPAPAIPPMAPPPGMGPAGAGPGLGAMGAMMPGGPGMSAPMPPMRKHGGRIAKQDGGALGNSGFDGGQRDMGGRPKGRSQFHRGPAGVGDTPSRGEPGMSYPGGSPNFDESTGMYRPGFNQPMPSPVMGGGMSRPSMPGKPNMGGREPPMQMGVGFPGGPPLMPPGMGSQMPPGMLGFEPWLGGGAGMQPQPMPMPMNPGNGMGGMRPPSFGQMPIGGGSQPIAQYQAPATQTGMMNAAQQAMPRKNGGRTMPKYRMKDVGSGGGLGRLEKRDFPPANGTAPSESKKKLINEGSPARRAYGGRSGKTGPLGKEGSEDMIFGTTKFGGDQEQTAQAEGQYAYKKGDSSNPYPKGHSFHKAWNEGYKKMSGDKEFSSREEKGRAEAIKYNEDLAKRREERAKKQPQLLDMFDRTYRPINIDKAYPKRGKKE